MHVVNRRRDKQEEESLTSLGHASGHSELSGVVGGALASALPLLLLLLQDLHPVRHGHLGLHALAGLLTTHNHRKAVSFTVNSSGHLGF